MGCLMSKKAERTDDKQHQHSTTTTTTTTTTKCSATAQLTGGPGVVSVVSPDKQYSWSNRTKQDGARFVVDGLCAHQVETRLPGQINGEQFVVQKCTGATVCLYDYSNTVMIDDCSDCTFFIGPVMGSIAVRNCDDCRIMCASQQFRSRDCRRLQVFMFCATQPAIESCTQLRFGCFAANYPALKDQFVKANLNIFNNKWSQVYDFSIDDQERHWTTFAADVRPTDLFRPDKMNGQVVSVQFDPSSSVVPQTLGIISLEFLQSHPSRDYFGGNNNSVSFDSVTLPASMSLDETSRLGLIYLFGHDTGNGIDLAVERLLQEISIKHKDLTLLMTKSFGSDQVAVKMSLLAEIDVPTCTTSTATTTTANNDRKHDFRSYSGENVCNRLLVLFYQGNHDLTVLLDLCHALFGSPQCLIRFKLVTDDQETDNFARYLSVSFENLISY